MATWAEFTTAEPKLASAVRALFCQYGPGLGYLATIRPDGGPRLHPVSPVITDEGLFCFVIVSPKRRDLDRDGRYALHAYPPEDSADEACISGHATAVTDREHRDRLAREMRAEPRVDWQLYEFSVDTAMVVRRDVTPPAVDVWRDPAAARR